MQSVALISLNIFDTVLNLPMHPLVVHFAVVLLPLAALGLAVTMFLPRLRRRYGSLAVILLAVGTGFAFVAKESGEALAARVGEPAEHAEWGGRLFLAALATSIIAVVWWFLERRALTRDTDTDPDSGTDPESGTESGTDPDSAAAPSRRGPVAAVLPVRIVTFLACLALAGVVAVTGHTGSKAAWSDAGSTGAEASKTQNQDQKYPMTTVQQHNSASSCWAVVDTGVYDLTRWINEHPGGADKIKPLCGTNATSQFRGKHNTEQRPNTELTKLRIGTLSG